jgi:hypothetical protein
MTRSCTKADCMLDRRALICLIVESFAGAASRPIKEGSKHEVCFRGSPDRRHGCRFWQRECRGRLRPRLASRAVWRMPAQPGRGCRARAGRCGTGCRGGGGAGGSGRGGTPSRLPGRFRLGLWTLPSDLRSPILIKQNPASGGVFYLMQKPESAFLHPRVMAGHSRSKNGVASARLWRGHPRLCILMRKVKRGCAGPVSAKAAPGHSLTRPTKL